MRNYLFGMENQQPFTSSDRRQFIKSASLALGATALASPTLAQADILSSALLEEIRGLVCSGAGESAVPLAGAEVSLYEATSESPRLLGTATANASGRFVLRVRNRRRPKKGSIFYLTAGLGSGLQLAAVVGQSLPTIAVINELTTVAAGYALAQFLVDGQISGDELALRIGAGMVGNLVSVSSGQSSPVITSSPNADQTISWRSSLSLANLLAHYVGQDGVGVEQLYVLTTPPGGSAPTTLLQALSNLARNPQENVAQIFDLSAESDVYAPVLTEAPDAWTLVVKVNDSGSNKHLFGGPGFITFDANGYAWMTNNVIQGTPNSSRFAVVLKPDGSPANGRGLGYAPESPLFGGGLLGGGYGVTVAPNGQVWFGNFGWGNPTNFPSPDKDGSVSHFTKNGRPLSGPRGYQGGPVRAQAVRADAQGNIWIASFGNNRLYVFPKGNPRRSVYFEDETGIANSTMDIQFAPDGTAWVTYSGGLGPNTDSAVGRFSFTNNSLQKIFLKPLGHSIKGVSVDSLGNGWLASGGDSCVYLLDPQGNQLGQFTGGGIDAPWGISVDGDDNVWVGNFGPEQPGNVFSTAAVTKLAGANPATRPPGLQTGDPISPKTGYTLPSAGEQVLMHNGEPLYGWNAPPCFDPLMRITCVAIDRAGNIWATNNWKPNFNVDLVNSGGDGVCIYLGLAKPLAVQG